VKSGSEDLALAAANLVAPRKRYLYDLNDNYIGNKQNYHPTTVEKGIYRFLPIDNQIDWYSLKVGQPTVARRSHGAWLTDKYTAQELCITREPNIE